MNNNISNNKEILIDNRGIKERIISRCYHAADYLLIYVYIIIVYGGALIADYLLFELMWLLLTEEVGKYEIVKLAFDYARIGLALLFLMSAVVHGIISTYSQILLDLKLAKQDKQAI